MFFTTTSMMTPNRRGVAIAPAGIVQSGLIVHLDAGNETSYSGTGSTWSDISGNSQDFDILDPGGLEAAPPHTSGTAGYFTLNNFANDLYFARTDAALPPGTGDFTISMWATKSELAGNVYMWDWGIGNLAYMAGGTNINASWRYWNPTTGSGSDLYVNSGPEFANKWYNVTVVRTSGSTSIYINNVLLVTDAGDTFDMSSTKLWIGRPGVASFDFNFNGRVAAFYMYHRALTTEELATNQSVFDSRYSISTNIEIVNTGLELYVDAGKDASYTGLGDVWTDMSVNKYRFLIADTGTEKYDPDHTPGTSGYFLTDFTTDLNFNLNLATGVNIGTSDYTMGAWVLLDDITANAYLWDWAVNVGSISYGTDINDGWRHSNPTIGTASAVSDSQPGPSIDTWYNLVVIRESGTTSIYANNVLLESVTGDTYNFTQTALVLCRTNIGYPTQYTMSGKLAVVYLYHRALSSGELATNQAEFESRYV